MSYIGIQDQKASQVRRFSVTGSTSATHLLTWVAANEQSLIVTINGVKQHDDAYTIAGNPTTVTLSSALVSTDKLEVIGIADVGQEITPADNSVGTLKLADDAVTNAKLGDNAVTNAKLVDNAVTNAKLVDSAVTLAKLSTSGSAIAGNYLDGTMTWTAVDSVPDLITEGDVYKNYKTFATNITIPVDADSNQGLIGPIAFTGDVTITGDLTIW